MDLEALVLERVQLGHSRVDGPASAAPHLPWGVLLERQAPRDEEEPRYRPQVEAGRPRPDTHPLDQTETGGTPQEIMVWSEILP